MEVSPPDTGEIFRQMLRNLFLSFLLAFAPSTTRGNCVSFYPFTVAALADITCTCAIIAMMRFLSGVGAVHTPSAFNVLKLFLVNLINVYVKNYPHLS